MWLTNLVPIFGGSITLAGSIYGVCVAAEKAARPDALREIAFALREPLDTTRGATIARRVAD
jgi:hypothetical protein